MDIKFNVNGLNIDYDFLGSFPEKMEKENDEALLNYFLECFKFTFTNTAFTYYGSLEDIKELIRDNLVLDETGYKDKTNEKKWSILLLTVLKMFYQMHNTVFADSTTDLIINNIDRYTDEQLNKTIHDLNFALFYGIEECLIVTPSKIREVKATDNDCFLLTELLDIRDVFISHLKNNVRKEDVNFESYEDLYREIVNKGFYETFYDGFLLSWVDMIEPPTEFIANNPAQWEEFLAEVYAVIYTFFGLLLKNENALNDLSNELYKTIATIIKNKFNIDFDVLAISLQ